MMNVPDVLEALKDVPPDKVAQFFHKAGVRGRRGSASHCPLANYLRVVAGVGFISIGHAVHYGGREFRGRSGHVPRVELPRNLNTFVQYFDEGKYPELVGDPEEEGE